MKKNTKKIATLALVGIVAVGSYFVSGTYAKYTSTIAGSGDANVAKWAWTINGTDIDTYEKSTAENAYTFDLLDTVNDSDGTSAEEDVDTDLIAPGMTGEFDIEIANKSEVNATYAIQLEETQTNLATGVSRVPIEYSTDGGSTWKSTIADANVAATDIAMKTGTATKTVKWRWQYSVDDTVDTKLGFAANTSRPNVKVTAKVVVTQVD